MGQAKKYQLVHGIELQVAMPSANGVLACLSRYSNISSQEAHNSVQDVLCLRDGTADAPTEKSKLPKTRVPRKQHIMQEMKALTESTVGGAEPSDGRNHFSIRFESQDVPQEDSHEWAPAAYLTL
jgi:hypothetical protein